MSSSTEDVGCIILNSEKFFPSLLVSHQTISGKNCSIARLNAQVKRREREREAGGLVQQNTCSFLPPSSSPFSLARFPDISPD